MVSAHVACGCVAVGIVTVRSYVATTHSAGTVNSSELVVAECSILHYFLRLFTGMAGVPRKERSGKQAPEYTSGHFTSAETEGSAGDDVFRVP